MTIQPDVIGNSEGDRRPRVLLDPYPGLRPFTETEQRLFFGRTQQIDDILQRLEKRSFALVTGGSGSGKSSIVNAGVIPALRKKQLSSRSDFWLVATFSPKDQPFRNLAAELAKIIEPLAAQSPSQLIDDIELTLLETNSLEGFFVRYENRIILEEGQAPESRKRANLLIFCDQFEEIFRDQNRDNPEANQLVNLLVEAYKNQERYPRLFVIIGMRSEDLHRCAAFIDLPNVINGSMFLTRRLDETEIASAIVEPMRLSLRLRGIRPRQYKPIEVDPWPFEVDILRRLNLATSTIARDPDHLPLLQHLLSVLWRYLDINELLPVAGQTPEQYQKFRITTDHLAAALDFSSISAMDAFVRSSDERHPQEKLAEAWILKRALDGAAEAQKPSGERFSAIAGIMLRLLAEVDDRGNYKRRWTSRQEILDVAADNKATPAEVEQIIAAFSKPYPFLNVKAGLDGKIDVSHESFIRNWTQFVDWLKSERHLATAYDLLRTRYLEYQRMLSDPQRNPLARLWLRLSNRLNNEQLVELADWRRTRSGNNAWARRYANGIRGEDPEFHRNSDRRDDNIETDQLNRNLLRYYQRSKLISYRTTSFAALGALALFAAMALWLETAQRLTVSERDESYRTTLDYLYSKTDGEAAKYGANSRTANKTLYELTGYDAIVRNILQPRGDLVGWLLRFYLALTWQTDSPGKLYYGARAAIDRETRRTLDNAMFPVAGRDDSVGVQARQTQLRPSCRSQLGNPDLKKLLREDEKFMDSSMAYQVRAPLEHQGGRQIAMLPTDGGSLVTFLLSDDPSCSLLYLQTLSLPPGKLEIGPHLGLVIVNSEGQKPEDQQSFVFRIWWTRRCGPEGESDGKCTKPFFAEIKGPALLRNGSFHIIDENHLQTINGTEKKRFELPILHRPVLLDAAEARTIEFSGHADDPKQSTCALSGRYAAVIKEAGKADPDGTPARVLDIIEHTAPIADCNQAPAGEAITSIPIGDYSIRRVTFSQSKDDNLEPEFVYLQGLATGRREAPVYKLALALRQMYCLSRQDLPSDNSADNDLSSNSQYAPRSEKALRARSDELAKIPSCTDVWGDINRN